MLRVATSPGLADRGRAQCPVSRPGGREHVSGAALLTTFLLMLVLAGLGTAVSAFARNSQLIGGATLRDQQAFYIAEAGLARARQALAAGTWQAAASPGNSYSESFGAGEYQVAIVDDGGGEYTITADGYLPDAASPLARRRVAEAGIAVTMSDGTNYALTATASASSSGASTPASNARDGDLGTRWRASTNGDGWLAMDFGSAQDVNKIIVREDANINGIVVEYSDNGTTWTAVAGQSVIESPSRTWTATFAAASHRYVRASIDAPNNQRPSVNELQCYLASVSALGQGEVTATW